jgi:predicted acylesterase/phospholipase RssA
MTESRKALILAGGGMKVAAQAGVLQVWLDEAGIQFDHADGCSGGTLNLAMYCQGMTGTSIAENWRNYRPLENLQINWNQIFAGPWAESLLRLDKMRQRQLPRWGLDWTKIQTSVKSATFNTYNFTRQELLVLKPSQMSPELLMACIALPAWFPPVVNGKERLIDAVYATDANLIDAVRHGADELWIIWTVSTKGDWRNGIVANYFQTIEACANSDLKASLEAIQENNTAVADGRVSQFGRIIGVRILEFEVPMHYLLELRWRRFPRAVELGIAKARKWCQDEGIPLNTGASTRAHSGNPPLRAPCLGRSLTFNETMKGTMHFSQAASTGGGEPVHRHKLAVNLRADIRDMEIFLGDPQHTAALTGTITCQALGGKLPVTSGTLELLPQGPSPQRTYMRYRLYFEDSAGHPLVLNGSKDIVHDETMDWWADTTTLALGLAAAGGTGDNIADGTIRLSPAGLLNMGLSFRSTGSATRRGLTLLRFLRFFLGRLGQIYLVRKNFDNAKGGSDDTTGVRMG